MEKLIFALWPDAAADHATWQQNLLTEAATALERLGAQRLKICVADIPAPANDPYAEMKRGAPSAYVSLWLNSATFWRRIDRALAAYGTKRAAYAVAESVILPLSRPLPPGERAPGVLQIAAFATLPQLTRAETLHNWFALHTDVAVRTQSTTTYAQNLITRPLTPDAPAWDAIVEETFPTAALTDRHLYFATGGSAEILDRHQAQMAESCARFIDFPTLCLIMASEFRFGGWADAAYDWHQYQQEQGTEK